MTLPITITELKKEGKIHGTKILSKEIKKHIYLYSLNFMEISISQNKRLINDLHSTNVTIIRKKNEN